MKKPNQKIRLAGTVENRLDAQHLLKSAGDLVLIERSGIPRWAVIRCPSGCGDDIALNLDVRTGSAWRIYHRRKQISIFPSVWRDSGCGSHFIVWNSKIHWCGNRWNLNSAGEIDPHRVLDILRSAESSYVNLTTIAEDLHAIPWDVLQVCRTLEKSGVLIEGRNDQRWHFRLRTADPHR
jgi:hypothetical protein